ncbi:MAG: ribosome-binding factor A [Actinomycetes bacterium]|jgi:ribosome-binding factor A
MNDESPRARLLAGRVKTIVAEMIEKRIKDPRLGFVTITDAYLTNDLREATVFYTVLGDPVEQQSSAMAMESAKGLIRSEVGKQTGVRHTPSLTFVADAMPETARHIEDLIEKSKESDKELHNRAAGAQFAGDSNPYREPRAEKQADE